MCIQRNSGVITCREFQEKILSPKFAFESIYLQMDFRYRLHDKKLPGKPDIVLPKYRVVIFINGCFWHGHENCKFSTIPKTNSDWWREKINKNKWRDLINNQVLIEKNWRIITIFGCELKNNNAEATLVGIVNRIKTHSLSG